MGTTPPPLAGAEHIIAQLADMRRTIAEGRWVFDRTRIPESSDGLDPMGAVAGACLSSMYRDDMSLIRLRADKQPAATASTVPTAASDDLPRPVEVDDLTNASSFSGKTLEGPTVESGSQVQAGANAAAPEEAVAPTATRDGRREGEEDADSFLARQVGLLSEQLGAKADSAGGWRAALYNADGQVDRGFDLGPWPESQRNAILYEMVWKRQCLDS